MSDPTRWQQPSVDADRVHVGIERGNPTTVPQRAEGYGHSHMHTYGASHPYAGVSGGRTQPDRERWSTHRADGQGSYSSSGPYSQQSYSGEAQNHNYDRHGSSRPYQDQYQNHSQQAPTRFNDRRLSEPALHGQATDSGRPYDTHRYNARPPQPWRGTSESTADRRPIATVEQRADDLLYDAHRRNSVAHAPTQSPSFVQPAHAYSIPSPVAEGRPGYPHPQTIQVGYPGGLQAQVQQYYRHSAEHHQSSHFQQQQQSSTHQQHVQVPFQTTSQPHHSSQPHFQHATITIMLPTMDWTKPSTQLHSWRELPLNPAFGIALVQNISELQKDEFRYYCDSCQHGFNSKIQWQAHLDDHVYCTAPGCNFTCRKDKIWKLDLHMEALHNRPDAPNLQDTASYLEQRKRRFPTGDNIESKVEELYYKASRGEVIPNERKRWLRAHGVFILRSGMPTKEPPPPRRRRDMEAIHQPSHQEAVAVAQEGAPSAIEQPTSGEGGDSTAITTTTAAVAPVVSTTQPAAVAAHPNVPPHQPHAPMMRRPKLIPEGFNGKLSHRQRVQLIREKYLDATEVPRFYVCHRCGEKGSHWVAECPTIGDVNFDRPNAKRVANEVPEEHGASRKRAREDEATQEGEDDAPIEVSAAPMPGQQPTPLVANPMAAAPMVRRRRLPLRPRPKPPSLFDRLTEDERVVEQGLLLQAIRFFVRSDFLGQGVSHHPGPTAGSDVGGGQAASDPANIGSDAIIDV